MEYFPATSTEEEEDGGKEEEEGEEGRRDGEIRGERLPVGPRPVEAVSSEFSPPGVSGGRCGSSGSGNGGLSAT